MTQSLGYHDLSFDVTGFQVLDQARDDRLTQRCRDHDRFFDHRHVLRVIQRIDVEQGQDQLTELLGIRGRWPGGWPL